ncbi:MAG: MBL fold metallo-hydrolase [Chloroflexi bacterium]|nr:MBL fold metallo-hydrolase [Chloroflexota bacterium]
MLIHFNGAAQTVTGSQHLLEINGKQLLLECGLFQCSRQESYRRNLTFRFDPHAIDAVILSHAHIDHSGNLPNLIKNGYSGPIYTNPATARLADIMLRDSAHVQESDVEYVNRKRMRRGEPPIEPLYTQADAERVVDQFVKVEYNQAFEPVPGVNAHLVDAGHILGSASVVLDIQENHRSYRLWFSGDIGRRFLPLLKDPTMPEAADYLIMECTYGDKSHDDPQLAYDELRETVQRTVKRGGKVIIPAFAVGRTQELVFELNEMMTTGQIPSIPVFVDSPLAVNATQVFQEFPQYFDEQTHEFIRQGRHPALNFKQLTYIHSVDESKALNDRHDPMVIISASGMAEAGRILHHLRNNIEDARNTVIIVGWQAPNTLGRRLAEVVTIGGFSAHAGQNMLLRYAAATRDSLKHLFLVHGEPRAAGAFTELLRAQNIGPIAYPALLETVEI